MRKIFYALFSMMFVISGYISADNSPVNKDKSSEHVQNINEAQKSSETNREKGKNKEKIVLRMTCGCKGRELEHCQRASREWEELTGVHIEVITLPAESNERISLYLQLLRAGSQDVDVFLIDVVWPGILANYLVDLNDYITDGERDEFFETSIKNNTVNNRLIALPWYLDIGVFYCRKDLLEKYGHKMPETWQQMEIIAADIQEKERKENNFRIWGYVFQGKSYEGLTVNTVEWLGSVGGGVVDQNGNLIIDCPQNVNMLKRVSGWIGNISPRGVLGYTEEEVRGVFQSGNAIFMRNWPYVWSIINSPDCPLAGKVGVGALPSGSEDGSRHVGGLGGWSLGVSKYSKHQAEAVAFIKYLSSRKEQKFRAMESGFSPSRPDLYKDKDVLARQPFFAKLGVILENMITRPSVHFGASYSHASTELFNGVHSVISGQKSVEDVLKQLSSRLNQFLMKNKMKKE